MINQNLDSQKFIKAYPEISTELAIAILEDHMFDGKVEGEFLIARQPDGFADVVCELSENRKVYSEDLINWLGY